VCKRVCTDSLALALSDHAINDFESYGDQIARVRIQSEANAMILGAFARMPKETAVEWGAHWNVH